MGTQHGPYTRENFIKSPEQRAREDMRYQSTVANKTQRGDLDASTLAALQKEAALAKSSGAMKGALPPIHGQMSPSDKIAAMRQINIALGRAPDFDFISNPPAPAKATPQPMTATAPKPTTAPGSPSPLTLAIMQPNAGNEATSPASPQQTPEQAARREALKLAVAAGVGRNSGGRVIDSETLTQGVLDPTVKAAQANPGSTQDTPYGSIGIKAPPKVAQVPNPLPGAPVAPPPAAPGTADNTGFPSRAQMTQSAKPTMGIGPTPGPVLAPNPAPPTPPPLTPGRVGQIMRSGLDSAADSLGKTAGNIASGIGDVLNAPSQMFQGFTGSTAPKPLAPAEPPTLPTLPPAAAPPQDDEFEKLRKLQQQSRFTGA